MRNYIIWIVVVFLSTTIHAHHYPRHDDALTCGSVIRQAAGALKEGASILACWLQKEIVTCPTFCVGLFVETLTEQPPSRKCLTGYAVVAGGTYACSQCTPWWPFFVCGCGMCMHSLVEYCQDG